MSYLRRFALLAFLALLRHANRRHAEAELSAQWDHEILLWAQRLSATAFAVKGKSEELQRSLAALEALLGKNSNSLENILRGRSTMKKPETKQTPRHFGKGDAEKAQDAAEEIIDPAMPAAGAGLMIDSDPRLNQVSETEKELKRLVRSEGDAEEDEANSRKTPWAATIAINGAARR